MSQTGSSTQLCVSSLNEKVQLLIAKKCIFTTQSPPTLSWEVDKVYWRLTERSTGIPQRLTCIAGQLPCTVIKEETADPPATARVQIKTRGCRYLHQLWQSGHIPLLCAVRRAFPYGKLVITVDAAAKMALLTTATKGMERQHMGRDGPEGGGRVEKKKKLHFLNGWQGSWRTLDLSCISLFSF